MTQADRILKNVYQQLNLMNATDIEKYEKINDIVIKLQEINLQGTINVKTTGTISERLCEIALRISVPNIYNTLGKDWKWIGDFSVLGIPFNLIISVKSFKAKERLMASGSGNVLSPTVGWGLFNDPNEWTEPRTKGYLFRAFIAIYLPDKLLTQLQQKSTNIKNINGKPFLRPINTFVKDLTNSLTNGKLDITKF
jgi:hypothetical protein